MKSASLYGKEGLHRLLFNLCWYYAKASCLAPHLFRRNLHFDHQCISFNIPPLSSSSSSYNFLTFLRKFTFSLLPSLPLPRNLKLRSLIPTSRHIIFDFCISCVSKTGNSKRALEPHDLKASWGHVRCYTAAASQRGPLTGLYECRKKQKKKNWWWFALRDANEAKALRPSLLLRQRAFFATVKKLRWCSLFWNEGNFEKMQLFSSSFVTAFRVRCNF